MARIMTRRKAIPKAIELLQCLPQTEEVVEVIQALKKYSSTPLDRWDAASVYEALDEWTESHNGIPPRIKECDSHKELPSHMVFEKLFGKTAKQWSEQNPKLEGNMRDYATAEQLVVLANLESLNAQFIKDGLEAEDRLLKLNNIAIEQLQLLLNYSVKKIEKI
mgnify:CR=1 FL=1